MRILAIDTSCDDTCISILEIRNSKFEIRSNIISSQVEIHRKYGGVYPSLAKREHKRNLTPVLKKALKEAGFGIFNSQFSIFKQIPKSKIPNLNFIAVTVGPGLDPCLWTGVNFAKELAQQWNLPIIPVNHIEAHILANFLPKVSSNFHFPISNFQKIFPAVCLVVSGGHTQLILMKGVGKYKIIGETRDDAAGECFDKTARILGLPYPGGPALAEIANQHESGHESPRISEISGKFAKISDIKLPRPMINSKDYDFSFSGLKTAVLYKIKDSRFKIKDKKYVQEMCYEIQQAIIDVLIKKTIRAAKDFKAKTILLGGGVSANNELRKQFQLKIKNLKLKINFLVPPKNLCTDNAAMVAAAGYFNRQKATKNLASIKAKANLRINVPRQR